MQEIEEEVEEDNEIGLSVKNCNTVDVITIYTSAAEGSHRLFARLLT